MDKFYELLIKPCSIHEKIYFNDLSEIKLKEILNDEYILFLINNYDYCKAFEENNCNYYTTTSEILEKLKEINITIENDIIKLNDNIIELYDNKFKSEFYDDTNSKFKNKYNHNNIWMYNKK